MRERVREGGREGVVAMPFRAVDSSPKLKLEEDGVGGLEVEIEVERRSASRLLFSSLVWRLWDRGRRVALSNGDGLRALDGGWVKEKEGLGEAKTKGGGGGVDGAGEGVSMDGMGLSGAGAELVLALPLV